MSIQHGGDGPIAVNVELQNADIFGISKATFTDDGSDLSTLSLKYKMVIPTFKVLCEYKVKGRVLQLPLNANGKATLTLDKALATFTIRAKKRKEGNEIFGVLENLVMELDDADKFQIHLENLFNGDKGLEDSVHAFLNGNWRSFFGIVRPGINEAVAVIMKDYFIKIFNYVPFSYLIDGLDE
ncbi:protein takeout-like [Haematobia irritans]|uniref:protein takeout-like n=1 Tax=Haematobia irritans TaxID=7368 RepID=UPI003F4FC248